MDSMYQWIQAQHPQQQQQQPPMLQETSSAHNPLHEQQRPPSTSMGESGASNGAPNSAAEAPQPIEIDDYASLGLGGARNASNSWKIQLTPVHSAGIVLVVFRR